MHKILIFVLFLISATAASQVTKVPAVTALGKPDGEKTEMKIGKEGGSFTSSDGKLRLLIPPGAISKKITFSIQPTTNLAPNGNGKSYLIEPSGVNFPQPLQLIFYYTKDELQGNSASLLGIAMQDEGGQWLSVNKMKADTTAKTLTAGIRHFSSYINYLKAKIDPSSARVKINGSLRLKITFVSSQSVSGDNDELSPLGTEIVNSPVWNVNGIRGGNSTVGSVSASQDYSAIYKAPAQIPAQNPVAVSVDFQGSSTNINERLFNNLKLVSNISIYGDAYEVKMLCILSGGSPLAWGGVRTYRDEGSFLVSLENNRPVVINIQNQMEILTDNCQNIILNPNSNTGLFHVIGARQIKITPANPPDNPHPIVELFFIPHPIEMTRYRFICPPPPSVKNAAIGKFDLSTIPLMAFMGKAALPQYLKFTANDDEQILLESPRGIQGFYYKVWVQKITD
ncbi:MAG: hypothetical protein H7096_03390 [Flavobacterium sp.]|nr:hypothetical protein [Pedobacter sp.]